MKGCSVMGTEGQESERTSCDDEASGQDAASVSRFSASEVISVGLKHFFIQQLDSVLINQTTVVTFHI